MSAGDTLFIGWTGTSPAYKELEPGISYEPSGDRTTIAKRLTRRIICFASTKDAVIQSLTMDNASITSVYVDANGALASKDCGGGWDLLTMDDAKYAVGFSVISLVYRKVVPRMFEMGLPAGVTVTQSAGVITIKYNNAILEQFDSGTGSSGKGLEIKSQILVNREALKSQTAYDEGAWFRLWFEVDGVVFDELMVFGSDLKRRDVVYRYFGRVVGPFSEPLTDQQKQEYIKAGGYDHFWEEIVYPNRRLGEPVPSESTAYDPNTGAQTSITYNVEQLRVREFYYTADARFSAPSNIYFTKTPEAKWSLVGSTLKILVENDIVWREWDVTGL